MLAGFLLGLDTGCYWTIVSGHKVDKLTIEKSENYHCWDQIRKRSNSKVYHAVMGHTVSRASRQERKITLTPLEKSFGASGFSEGDGTPIQ